jgi:uroporphyrinogen-III synthase
VKRPLIVIRPEPGNTATCARARELGFDARAFPLFAVAPVAWVPPDPAGFTAVLATSANALRHAGAALARYLHLPGFAVGEATAAAMRDAGFISVVSGERDVAAIVAKIGTLGYQTLLHLAGQEATPFESFGIAVEQRVVYASEPVGPGPEWAAALAERPIVLVHSPRAAARLGALAGDARSGIAIVAISAAAAQAPGTGWQEVAVADEPRDEAMLALAARFASEDRIPS